MRIRIKTLKLGGQTESLRMIYIIFKILHEILLHDPWPPKPEHSLNSMPNYQIPYVPPKLRNSIRGMFHWTTVCICAFALYWCFACTCHSERDNPDFRILKNQKFWNTGALEFLQ